MVVLEKWASFFFFNSDECCRDMHMNGSDLDFGKVLNISILVNSRFSNTV